VLPVNRHQEVMRLAHEIYAGYLGAKETKERIKLSFTWPTIAADVQKTCESCHQCQKKRRVTVYDRVPVMPIPRGDVLFDSIVMDKIKKCHIKIDEATCDTVTTGHENTELNHCAVIYKGSVDVIDTDQFQQPELVPSQRVDLTTLSHLSVEQRIKLLALLDKYLECFSEKPGFFTVDQYKFDNFADCKPLRLKVNYMLEDLKPLVEARLHELFRFSSMYLKEIEWGPQ